MVNLCVPLDEILQVSVSLDCALQIVATKMRYYSSLVSRRFIGHLNMFVESETNIHGIK
jgi:hypothetical protein